MSCNLGTQYNTNKHRIYIYATLTYKKVCEYLTYMYSAREKTERNSCKFSRKRTRVRGRFEPVPHFNALDAENKFNNLTHYSYEEFSYYSERERSG